MVKTLPEWHIFLGLYDLISCCHLNGFDNHTHLSL